MPDRVHTPRERPSVVEGKVVLGGEQGLEYGELALRALVDLVLRAKVLLDADERGSVPWRGGFCAGHAARKARMRAGGHLDHPLRAGVDQNPFSQAHEHRLHLPMWLEG